jgi:amino acid permease
MSSVYSEQEENKFILYHTKDLESAFIDNKSHVGEAGYLSTCINLLKSIIGSGLLALPYTFKALGPILSIPLLFLFAYFSIVGLRIYSLCGMRAGVDSIGLVCKLVDWRLQMSVDVALLIMCIGTSVSYFSIIGDFIPNLMGPFSLNRNTCVILSGFILLPLTFLKNTRHLRYTSILGLVGVVFIFYLSIQLLFTQGLTSDRGPLIQFSNEGFKQLNVLVFVFTCHQNVTYDTYYIYSYVLLATSYKI